MDMIAGTRVRANYRAVPGTVIRDDPYPAWVWVKWDDGLMDRHPRALLTVAAGWSWS